MNIAVIGAGYVGLVTAGGLSELDHKVRVGEIDPARVAQLQTGEVPIFEEGLPELLARAVEKDRITYHSSNLEAVADADYVFLCLPTPELEDGRADLRFVHAVVDELVPNLDDNVILVIKINRPSREPQPNLRKRIGQPW